MRLLRNPFPARSLWSLAGVAGLGALLVLPAPDREAAEPPEVLVPLPVVAEAPEESESLTLRSGETLGEILERASLAPRERNAFLLAFRERASPRRMRVGTEITFRWGRERARELREVDVQLSPDETVRVRREGLVWASTVVETPVTVDTLRVAGAIRGSLWAAVVQSPDLDEVHRADRELLLHRLDQVFQWQVDFSREILDGDGYRFVVEREVRPDGSLRSVRILVAELLNRGRSLHAVWFDPGEDGRGAYFDLDGNSVRRAFLRKPLEFRRISSRFTYRRFHPILRRWRAHRGVDYAADAGTPVLATGDGVVVHRGPRGGYGNLVEIRHRNGYSTRYAHLQRFATGLRTGDRVAQGDVVGYVGSTGLATAPHLHYEFRQNGQALNPLSVDIPAGEPVPPEARGRWAIELGQRLALLGPPAPSLPPTGRADEDE